MKKIIILWLLFIGNFIYAQEDNRIIPINVSYFGETITHPGIEVGYEYNFFKGFNVTAAIGTYVHQRNHAALFLSGDLNWRYTFSFGYSPEIGIGLGYLHTWEHGGPVYIVDDNNNASIKPKYGRPSFMPSAKLGLLGWDLRKKTNIPMRINTDIVYFGQLPFNNYFLSHLALRIGATYYFELKSNKNRGY